MICLMMKCNNGVVKGQSQVTKAYGIVIEFECG
ncbi:hypothetical protein BDCR2A_01047 [Borrelia duttonii CR2A]|uniref:Uncharacterized protein n=1 Tax=Borrelia duttonii CR2A TaxID=1432657 RepID=W6TNN1_9SPIR|nr:hypothetical protein BDCR2A_01953 [Borrelia duttonii CR2A]ETZ19074.1 hypothetical protein BDCR2A_01047 [Borrelia duttonii CR2A]